MQSPNIQRHGTDPRQPPLQYVSSLYCGTSAVYTLLQQMLFNRLFRLESQPREVELRCGSLIYQLPDTMYIRETTGDHCQYVRAECLMQVFNIGYATSFSSAIIA